MKGFGRIDVSVWMPGIDLPGCFQDTIRNPDTGFRVSQFIPKKHGTAQGCALTYFELVLLMAVLWTNVVEEKGGAFSVAGLPLARSTSQLSFVVLTRIWPGPSQRVGLESSKVLSKYWTCTEHVSPSFRVPCTEDVHLLWTS